MHSYAFPGDLDENIAKIGSQPIPYMRTDEFGNINKESEQMLLELIHCTNGKTIIYTGSGTGAMSAIVENYVSTKNKAIAINGGSFGHRWVQLCEYYNIPVVNFEVPFAKDVNYASLKTKIAEERPDVLLCQHHETSSGQMFDLKKISDICHKYNVSIVVDVISSFLAEKLNMDELDLDICVTSTQKGLNVPPGLAIVFISKKLENYNFNHKGYYWDFETNLDNLRRGQTPYSPATLLHLQLHARLKQLINEGGEYKNQQELKHRASFFRELCKKYGWQVLAETPSNAITGFQTNEKTNRSIFKGLLEKYETAIMPSGTPGFYRVSHMGLQTEKELTLLAERIHEFEII